MEATEHTFPLPEVEKQKLDEVTQLARRPDVCRTVTRFVRLHIWKMVGLCGAAGIACGVLLGSGARRS
jgi:ElaB/YqjD/DUF883 family membrane-anchored ribosome-binding protein